MYHRVLVPLDGSPFAEQAVPFAAAIARRRDAILDLTLVHQPVPAWSLVADAANADQALLLAVQERERAYLDETAGRLRADGLAVEVTTLFGHVPSALAEHVDASGADLVVMTTHGRGPLSRFWVGSVADAMVRRVSVPVLLVRPRKGVSGRRTTFRRVLIPLDRSELAETALEPALALVEPGPARLVLLEVLDQPAPVMEPPLPYLVGIDPQLTLQQRELAEGYLAGVAERLRGRGFGVETRVGLGAGTADAVLAQAKTDRVDLIALATHGAGGLRRLALGSVADKIVRGADRPVLVVPPRDRGE
ncbi:MAG TPA: universal stress protein [Gemmatimonadales bacterium]|nr:universal stress protein [Gemmatimonadales bacterium]